MTKTRAEWNFRTALSKLVHFLGSRVPFENLLWSAAQPSSLRPITPSFSADGERQGLTLTPLVFLQKLNPVVAVELDGSPVAVVADQQRALLQAAFTVGLGGDSELGDVLGQVLFDCRTLRLRPGTLQNPSLSYKCGENNRSLCVF